MNLQILEATKTVDWKTFIEFWSDKYFYSLEDLYNENIKKAEFDAIDINNFFKWKNGSDLSELKKRSLENKIIAHLKLINNAKKYDSYLVENHFEIFNRVSAVWNIFLLHLIKPDQYPIYDQHIHRAFAFITGTEDFRLIKETISDKRKYNFYSNTYLPFIQENLKDYDLKKIDEAFFAFGQFLKTKTYAKFFAY